MHKQGNLTCKNCRISLKCLFMEELLEESLGYQSAMLYNTMLRGVMFDALYKVGNGYYIGRKGGLRCIVRDNGFIVYPWVEMKIRYFKTIEMFKIKNDFEAFYVKCFGNWYEEYLYDKIRVFTKNFWLVQVGDKKALTNPKLELLSPFFRECYKSNGRFYFLNEQGMWGGIWLSCKNPQLITPAYEKLVDIRIAMGEKISESEE